MVEGGVRSSRVVSDCYLAQCRPPGPPPTIQPVIVKGYCHPLREGDSIQNAVLPTEAWSPIFNGGDQKRQHITGLWASEHAQAVAVVLREHGLLVHDARGRYALQGEKLVCSVYALRCLPGAGPQPSHVDVSRNMVYQ